MPDLKTLRRWVSEDWKNQKQWRMQAREDFRFVAGDQWTTEEKEYLAKNDRPFVVFNRTATIINTVAGSEINNRTEVKFFPRTLGDAEVNETLTKGAEWFRDQGGAEEEDSQAFYDQLVCGLGWVETLMDFEEDSDGQPAMDRIDPLEMGYDSSAQKRGLTDARRIMRVRDISLAEAREMFEDDPERPKLSASDLNAGWLEKDEGKESPHRVFEDDQYAHADENDLVENMDDTVTLVQMQYRVRTKEVEFIDPLTGRKDRLGKGEFKRAMDALRKLGYEIDIPKRDVYRNEWKQVFLGNKILEENQPCRDRPTFTPITGYWDNHNREWFGLLRVMKDPQRFANKWLSQVVHVLDTNSKGGVMVEEDAVDDHEDFEERWSAADSVIWTKQGAIAAGKIQPKQMAPMPQALMGLTEFAISSIRDCVGVNMELLGMRDENQPGILEYQRKQAAMTTLAVLFDALRQYRKQQAEVMLFYMTEYLADGRLIRITDERGERYEPLQIDPGVRKYDVIVGDAPTSPNNKERVWETIMAMMPLLQQAGLPAKLWGEIIEYSPFPQALIEKFKEYAQTADQQGDPKQDAIMQAQLQKLAAETEKAMAGSERDRANAFENIAQGLAALAQADAEPAQAWAEIEKDRAQQELAIAKLGTDADKGRADVMAKLAQIASAERTARLNAQSRGNGGE